MTSLYSTDSTSETQLNIDRPTLIKAIRGTWTLSGERQPCAVCGKYKSITEVHHIIPASKLADIFIEHNVNIDILMKLDVLLIWLCPNHHALFHAIENLTSKSALLLIEDVGIEEYQSLEPLFTLQSENLKSVYAIILGVQHATTD